MFSNNTANYVGDIDITDSGNIFSGGDFNTANSANYGGGIYIIVSSHMFFQGNSTTVFSNNIADYGGGIYIFASSKIFFKKTLLHCSVIILLIMEELAIYIFTSSNIATISKNIHYSV